MTLLQAIGHVSHAHDGLDYAELVLDGRRVSVRYTCRDGSSHTEYAGTISEPGVWESACEAAEVGSVRLVDRGGVVWVELGYDGWDGEYLLTRWNSAGAWLRVPAGLFDEFAAIIEANEEGY